MLRFRSARACQCAASDSTMSGASRRPCFDALLCCELSEGLEVTSVRLFEGCTVGSAEDNDFQAIANRGKRGLEPETLSRCIGFVALAVFLDLPDDLTRGAVVNDQEVAHDCESKSRS